MGRVEEDRKEKDLVGVMGLPGGGIRFVAAQQVKGKLGGG